MNARITQEALRLIGPAADAAAWRRSQRRFPGPAAASYLRPRFLRAWCARLAAPVDFAVAVIEAATLVRADELLARLLWHDYWELCVGRTRSRANPCRPEERMGMRAGMFPALLALASLPQMQTRHAALGIPRSVTADTQADLLLWMRHYRDHHCGQWGLAQFGWLCNHLFGKLYRLGRLQFVPRVFNDGLAVYRHVGDQRVQAFAAAGVRFCDGGNTTGPQDARARGATWTARFRVSPDTLNGHPIRPEGKAERRPIRLARRAWAAALLPGMTVLDTHIPAEAPLDFDACGESLERARRFFPRYHGEEGYRGFVCVTWLFDNQFPHLLPADSNIVRFQREWHLYPVAGGDRQACERVFDQYPLDPATAPKRTRLQRALLAHAAAGGRFRAGGGFILMEDLDWGSAVYARQTKKGPRT